MKKLLTGNEAVARGAYEAGVTVAAAYPGTPSTEILENIAKDYPEVYAEWAPNEKVALEVAAGASIAGARSIATMKHVGVNVAADPLMTLAYTGVNGGFTLVSADDPGMHSSQNEQDNRYYAKFGKMALFEPSDSQEAKDFLKEALRISEEYDVATILRLTTRICHCKTLVEFEDRNEVGMREYVKNAAKFVATPANAKVAHPALIEKLARLEEYSNNTPLNNTEYNDTSIGIITSGISYQYAKEVFGDKASYLKLGFTNPLPNNMIKDFASKVERIIIIEEGEPYLEEAVKTLGIDCTGKDVIPRILELNPEIVKEALTDEASEFFTSDAQVPPRPPVLCAGCPHRGLFFALGRKKDRIVSTDIGCYTLGTAPPLSCGDTVICMGASISAGHGFQKAFEKNNVEGKKVYSVIGDSTFFHSGLTGMMDVIYNKGNSTVVIADNRITGMTGHQENPGTGKTLQGEETEMMDIGKIVSAMGVKNVIECDPLDVKKMTQIFREADKSEETTVIITKRACALLPDQYWGNYEINQDECTQCKACFRIGCPCISDDDGVITIDETQCIGCGLCSQLCGFNAIVKAGDK